jgi:ADP-heptose:LPS heptosyltransferase
MGDTFCASPTLKQLCHAYGQPINVVTHNKQVFKNNPYVQKLLNFDEFSKISINKDTEVLDSFVLAGKRNQFGTERKFSHVDLRQTHANDLGFQLLQEEMSCDFFPDKQLKLNIILPKSYVVLHVTKNWANRTWDKKHWEKIIEYCELQNISVVLIGKDYVETDSLITFDKKCEFLKVKNGLDLTNQGNLSDLWHIINGGKLIITMDSGPLHIAGTTDTFILQLGSAKDPRFSAPYRNGTQNYKYFYIKGDCDVFCNTNLKYSVREWNTINAVPPLHK